MIPGRHVKKMFVDMDEETQEDIKFIMGNQSVDDKNDEKTS